MRTSFWSDGRRASEGRRRAGIGVGALGRRHLRTACFVRERPAIRRGTRMAPALSEPARSGARHAPTPPRRRDALNFAPPPAPSRTTPPACHPGIAMAAGSRHARTISRAVSSAVEQWTFNPLVDGSNPSRPTISFISLHSWGAGCLLNLTRLVGCMLASCSRMTHPPHKADTMRWSRQKSVRV